MARQRDKTTIVVFENIDQQQLHPPIKFLVGLAFFIRPEFIVLRHRGFKDEVREGLYEGGFGAAPIAGMDAVGFAEELHNNLLAHAERIEYPKHVDRSRNHAPP